MLDLKVGINASHLKQEAMKCKTLPSLSRMQDESIRRQLMKRMTPQQYAEYLRKRDSQPIWAPVDDALTRLGYRVDYLEDGTKQIEKYNSNWVQHKTKQYKIGFNESELLSGVKKVAGDCDLRGTTLEDLSGLKSVGKTLILDTASPIKDLSGLKKIGTVLVHAKNKGEMQQFLSNIKFPISAIKGNLVHVMKNFL